MIGFSHSGPVGRAVTDKDLTVGGDVLGGLEVDAVAGAVVGELRTTPLLTPPRTS